MIERHINFKILSDKTKDFEKFFIKEYKPAMARMPGFIKVELLRQQEDPTTYQMVIRFESTDTASAWRASAAHQELSPRLKALHAGSMLNVYEVVA